MKRPVIVLLHIGYWILYLFLLFLLIAFIKMGAEHRGVKDFPLFNFVRFIILFAVVPAALGYAVFCGHLFSRYLKRRKILALFTAGLLVSLGAAVTGALLLTVFTPSRSLFIDGMSSALWITFSMALIALLNGCMGLIIKGFITFYADIKLKEELTQKNHETELALIRSQLDPHFLFNTINNIDVLIEMDAKKASAYLNKLSHIMRFMLYETKTEKISLADEIKYIEKYIDLQKIRASDPQYVQYTVTGNTDGVTIEPMLFIPFIENAFKHADKSAGNAISIHIAVETNAIIFDCSNKYRDDIAVGTGYKGLGNELIRKRLSLLYPGRHILEIKNDNSTYHIKLQLKLHEDQLYHSRR